TAATSANQSADRTLSQNLHTIREMLRERCPSGVSVEQPVSLHVDSLLAVDERSFYVRGWMHSGEAELTRLSALAPEGDRVELLPRLFRFSRADILATFGDSFRGQDNGFKCFFQMPTPRKLASGWVLEAEDAAGNRIEAAVARSI